MSVRFYTRTSPTRGYSTGPILELVRLAWPVFIIAVFVSSVLGVLEGDAGYLPLVVAMGLGGWWGVKRQEVR